MSFHPAPSSSSSSSSSSAPRGFRAPPDDDEDQGAPPPNEPPAQARAFAGNPVAARQPARGLASIWNLVSLLWSFVWGFGASLFSAFIPAGARRERRDLDPAAASARFLLDFEQSYGASHPQFYQGSYNQALREAQQSFRFLLVYLHCEDHQDTDAFCRQTMTSPELAHFVAEQNVILWCGIPGEQNAHVGSVLGQTSFPFLALIGLNGGRFGVLGRVDGLFSPADTVQKLAQVAQRFSNSLRGARFEQEERERERELRNDQEREFQESLRADQEKERRLQEERDAKERQLEEQRRQEEMRLAEIELVRLQREQKASQLPPEPAQNEAGVTLLVFRLLDGSRIQRRFRDSDTVGTMYNFIESRDIGCRSFHICTNLPKVIYSNKEVTLKEAGLTPKALVIVEDAS